MAVDDPARKQRGELRLRPADHLHGRAVHQHLRLRSGPEHPVDEVVRAVRRVGNTVPVQIESRVVAPVVAASALRPIEVARTDILDLIVVADEGVSGALRMADTGQDMIAWTVQAL